MESEDNKKLVDTISEQLFTLDSIIRKLFPSTIKDGKKIRKSINDFEFEIEEALKGDRSNLYSLEIEIANSEHIPPRVNYFFNISAFTQKKYQALLGSYPLSDVLDPKQFLFDDERIMSRAALIYKIFCLQEYSFLKKDADSARISLMIDKQRQALDRDDEFFTTMTLEMYYGVLITDHLTEQGETRTINLG